MPDCGLDPRPEENAIKDVTLGQLTNLNSNSQSDKSVASMLNLLMLVTIQWFYGYVSGHSYSSNYAQKGLELKGWVFASNLSNGRERAHKNSKRVKYWPKFGRTGVLYSKNFWQFFCTFRILSKDNPKGRAFPCVGWGGDVGRQDCGEAVGVHVRRRVGGRRGAAEN